ncbi:hypothetical protein PLESTB_001939400 [Pleodorina starrii]|uniref:Coenzyme Q-binding protein COQ10 START domain-containing protein n=1 Tax=Pleodorina starrii TaxID=330485 RepID=A0A9W6C1Y7_9CHLO|nr:hypothetical protein PLESTM_001011900 [Pleodorina starrii]GLC62786.1 hypothetical protein PLESTB_001939400 [Pleodorina starrii]GLC77406.1 hypothetical protein PLESTF_001932100 [Pleodorina starrii]
MNVLRNSQQAGFSGRTMERGLMPWRRRRAAQCSAVTTKAQAVPGVRIEVEKTSWTSRRVFAAVVVAAPKGCVWDALTDYDNLGNFVPSLVENRCLERTANSAVVYQVGAQDVAMGVKFSAAVSLRCTEFPDGGVPRELMTPPPPGAVSSGSSSSSSGSSLDAGGWGSAADVESLYPFPLTSAPGAVPSDISFELVEGDFQVFRGIWRMQQVGEMETLLSYALFVKPQAWLPVALIQGRIENEVVRNLEALRQYAEAQYQRQLQLQQEQQLGALH